MVQTLPDGLDIEIIQLCRYGAPGERKTLSYSTAMQLIIRGYAVIYKPDAQPKAETTPVVIPTTSSITDNSVPFIPQGLNTFVLVSAKNGCGLQTDYEILQELLRAAGKSVYVAHASGHGDPPSFRNVDVVFFLEIVDARWLQFGKQIWIAPNSEWWRKEWDQFIPKFDLIICKTRDCFNLWRKRSEKCVYTSFESRDLYDPTVPRKKEFLHMAGGSVNKGSKAVLTAWKNYRIPYPLTVVGANLGCGRDLLVQPNVRIIHRLPDIRRTMNEHLFHILPSRYEGWGHVLHEGLGCGAVMLTTDASPMNEAAGLSKELLIPVEHTSHLRVPNYPPAGESMTLMHDVSPASVWKAVQDTWCLTPDQITDISKNARASFLQERDNFRNILGTLLTPKLAPQVTISPAKQDVVLVTTFYRPEYLWTVLQALADADGGADKEVWVAHDHHHNEGNRDAARSENEQIAAHFKDVFAKFRWIDRETHSYEGNSYNCLELYKEAHGSDFRFVYLVEDDIVVEKDFFRWHEAVQAKGDYLCSVGRLQTTRPDLIKSDDPSAYVESGSDYTSWGSCWRREKLSFLMEHCQGFYYRNMTGYIINRFPDSSLGHIWTEQDGLIRRVLMEGKHLTASPCVKRAYHIGITGYHRAKGYQFTGTLSERVQKLNDALETGALPGLRKDFVDLDDIDVPRGSTSAWGELRTIQRLS